MKSNSKVLNCHTCWYVEGITDDSASVVVQLGHITDRNLRFLCARHLFDAVRDRKLVLSQNGKPITVDDKREDGTWNCWGCKERTGSYVQKQRVMELGGASDDRFLFLCPDCLLDDVINERLTVSEPSDVKTATIEYGYEYECTRCGGEGHDEVAQMSTDDWLCPKCLFETVQEDYARIKHPNMPEPVGFSEVNHYVCYGCHETKKPVGYFRGAHETNKFLCIACLFRKVVEGSLSYVINRDTPAAAPSGPTATVNKESGAVSVDGITFRW